MLQFGTFPSAKRPARAGQQYLLQFIRSPARQTLKNGGMLRIDRDNLRSNLGCRLLLDKKVWP